MNIYLYIILSILIIDYFLTILSKKLSLKSLNSNIPEEFEDIINQKDFLKAQKYNTDNIKYSFVMSTFSFLTNLFFIFGGVYNILDQFVRSANYGSVLTGLFFFGLLFLILDIINLPFSIYKIFVIEEKYGFNKTTPSTFIIDKFKGYFLFLIIGGPILSFILFFFEYFLVNAWIYVWFIIIAFSLFMQPLFNLIIAPMFNRFTALKDKVLLEKITDYLNKVNFPIKRIEIMDGSKRSTHSNAYFSGFGQNKRIALFDTLLEEMTDDEIIAIIGHEVGHYKLKHIYFNILFSVFQSGIMLYFLSYFIKNKDLFNVFKMEDLSIYGSLLFFSILFTPLSLFVNIMFNYFSRINEFSADKYSAETTNLSTSLITALKKMSKNNFSNLTPHWFNVVLSYSHPSVIDRILVLRSINK